MDGGRRQRRIALVGVVEALQLEPVVANVGDIQQGVLGQRLLHAEEVALDVAVLGVLGDVGDVVGAGLKLVARPAEEALIQRAIAGARVQWTGWVTETNSALGALMGRMSPEPARV